MLTFKCYFFLLAIPYQKLILGQNKIKIKYLGNFETFNFYLLEFKLAKSAILNNLNITNNVAFTDFSLLFCSHKHSTH